MFSKKLCSACVALKLTSHCIKDMFSFKLCCVILSVIILWPLKLIISRAFTQYLFLKVHNPGYVIKKMLSQSRNETLQGVLEPMNLQQVSRKMKLINSDVDDFAQTVQGMQHQEKMKMRSNVVDDFAYKVKDHKIQGRENESEEQRSRQLCWQSERTQTQRKTEFEEERR